MSEILFLILRGENILELYQEIKIAFRKKLGRAVAEAVSRWLPTAAARVRAGSGKWDLWWTNWRRGRFSPSTSVSPAKTIHSTNFSILTITHIYIYIYIREK
jgi:hypothetical protein